ncbi:MAG: polysaccharide pyruvyl transferase family protein [Candidatus Thorarchaeota archaeon]
MKSISLHCFVGEKLYKAEEKGNFGDEISPIIVQNLIGSDYDLRYNDDNCDERLLAIGSLLHDAQPNDYIFGTGFGLEDNDKLSELNVCAVRGPLSREKLLEIGVDCPEVYGDAALLLPDYYEPNYLPNLEGKIGVVPHWTTYPHYEKLLANSKQFYFINPTNSWQQVIDEIYSCDKIVSQALHGLICADAYQTPNVWLEENIWACVCGKLSVDSVLNPIEPQPPCSCGWNYHSIGKNLPFHNGNFKFLDYLASQNREVSPISHLREAIGADYYEDGNQIDLELLRNSFPFGQNTNL